MTQVVNVPEKAPGVCFVCEQANPVRFIDTLRHFDPGVVNHLNGRKYVCEECVAEFAHLLGFLAPDKAEVLKDKVAAAEKVAEDALKRAEALESVAKAVAVLHEVPAPEKPKAKKAAPKEG